MLLYFGAVGILDKGKQQRNIIPHYVI